ncbi:MAG: radical SAM protein [bacterium]|nr:radical SAM protein [bacterium]
MLITGIQKTTFLDYPGKISTIIFTSGCNFRCRFCHNPENVLPEQIVETSKYPITEEAFFSFLEKRKDTLDAVVICGGEPTLQPDLFEFASKVKNKGFLVKLDTNGRDVQVVKKMLDA